jgi:hypothetical protein
MRTLTYQNRLPGVAVKAASPQRRQDPLRLDVVGFVGFAERGPLDTPILIEDIDQYQAVFGGDVPLARSEGQPVYAQLPRAVQGFFENGGQRCYVVRVASQKARPNHFRLSGLVRWTPDEGLSSVVCPAASPGKWSSSVRIATRLSRRTLLLGRQPEEWVVSPDGAGVEQAEFHLLAESSRAILRGDLLRVDLNDSRQTRLFLPVEEVAAANVGNAESSALRTVPVIVRTPLRNLIAFATHHPLPDKRLLTRLEYLCEGAGADEEDDLIFALQPRHIWRSFEPDASRGELVYRFDLRGGLRVLDDLFPLTFDGKQRLRLTYKDGLVLDFPITGEDSYRLGNQERQCLQATALHFSTESLRTVERLTQFGWMPLPKLPSGDIEFLPGSTTAPYRLQFPLMDTTLDADDILRLRLQGGHNYLLPVSLVDVGYRENGLPYLAVEGRALWQELALVGDLLKALRIQPPLRASVQTFDLHIREGREIFRAQRGMNFISGERADAPYWAETLAEAPYDIGLGAVANALIVRYQMTGGGDTDRIEWDTEVLGNQWKDLSVTTRHYIRRQIRLKLSFGMQDFSDDSALRGKPLGEVANNLIMQESMVQAADVSRITMDTSVSGIKWSELSPQTRSDIKDLIRRKLAYGVAGIQVDRLRRSVASEELLSRSTYLMAPEGSADQRALFFPLDMAEEFLPERDPYAWPLLADEWHDEPDNGLSNTDPLTMFLDPTFIQRDGDGGALPPAEVAARANEKFFTGVSPQRLVKLHSLYVVDEVSLIAIPDLGQARALCRKITPFYVESDPVNVPERRTFEDCEPPKKRKRNAFSSIRRRAQTLETTALDMMQQLADLPEISLELEACDTLSDLLGVHRAMIHMAAARGDVMAILSLPYEFDWRHVLEWHQQLIQGSRQIVYGATLDDPYIPETTSPSPLAAMIRDAPPSSANPILLSYAAVFHGWVWTREETTPQLRPIRAIPPDGPICGMIAARERSFGPGVAPANVPLRGVVGLAERYTDAQWEFLYNRQINVIHQRPGRLVTLSSFTLTQEERFLQISFRRMTIWLRKLVLQEGSRFVFETNSERFRRSVQMRLQDLFERLLANGSLLAYQIDAGEGVNTREEVEAGRFIIEIRVAFTYPIEFITIVLLRTGETLLEVSER